jgi:iron only hydrogenase large subunit-like protein
MNKFTKSVQLKEELCQGCINCLKHCPTHAIRVHNNKATIIDKFCIDCGRCIRYCPHHAKIAVYDPITVISKYKYTIALPPPALYSQFHNLTNVDTVLNAFLDLGFDDVFEVGAAAELVSHASREYLQENKGKGPIISSACPSVVRLIRVKFPTLLPKLLPIKAPVEIAAQIARKRAIEVTGLPSKDIGIIFISPCPSKASYIKFPLGIETSQIDHAVAIKDVYPLLLPLMNRKEEHLKPLSRSGRIGLGWGHSGGEIGGLLTDNYIATDGIVNINRVLEDLEDEKIRDVEFVELNACGGGCVGGVSNVENAYAAVHKTQKLKKYQPVSRNRTEDHPELEDIFWEDKIGYEPVFRLGENFKESFKMLQEVEDLTKELPGLDCGSCGAPTCQTLAEDIVRGDAQIYSCIYLLRHNIYELVQKIHTLSLSPELSANHENAIKIREHIQELTDELAEFAIPMNKDSD